MISQWRFILLAIRTQKGKTNGALRQVRPLCRGRKAQKVGAEYFHLISQEPFGLASILCGGDACIMVISIRVSRSKNAETTVYPINHRVFGLILCESDRGSDHLSIAFLYTVPRNQFHKRQVVPRVSSVSVWIAMMRCSEAQ